MLEVNFLNHVMGQKIAIMSDKAQQRAQDYGDLYDG